VIEAVVFIACQNQLSEDWEVGFLRVKVGEGAIVLDSGF